MIQVKSSQKQKKERNEGSDNFGRGPHSHTGADDETSLATSVVI
jgi:hypothetical protein